MSGKKLGIGILGCGPISQFAHLESVQKARNSMLVAVCDADEGLAQQFGRFYDAKNIYLDYDRMLADPDVEAIIIGIADAFHVPAALKALAAGKHVLCEKPVGVTVEEVEELEAAVRKSGRVLQIGAWRMACACRPDAAAALREMAEDYIEQRYEHEPGKAPLPAHVSRVFSDALRLRFGGREAEVLSHPRRRLHVFTSRGKGMLARQGRVRTPLGYVGAFAANLLHRKAMGLLLERVVFSDARSELPLALHEYPTQRVPLSEHNLAASILASCSIPFWLDAVHDIAGAPRGAYWDGGITDYHMHLDYSALHEGLVLMPHFQPTLVPGWLDKPLKRRHRASAHLDNAVLLVPRPEWVAGLPNGKLPDRSDFRAYGDDAQARMRAWRIALAESERLADEFHALLAAESVHADPLP